jgi:tetratricopeptide (TPR) repeat protein
MNRVYKYFRKRFLFLIKITHINKVLIWLLRLFFTTAQQFEFISKILRKYPWYYLNLAQILRQLGDSCGALKNLTEGLKFHHANSLFYFRISQIYRENYEINKAHHYLKLAEQYNPSVHTIYKLCFESDHRLFDEGERSMIKVLNFPVDTIRSHLNHIDRVSIYYPKYQDKLELIRHKIKQELLKSSYGNSKDLSSAVAELISYRQIQSAFELSISQHISLIPNIQLRLDRIINCLGENIELLDCAWQNEFSEDIYIFIQGDKLLLKDVDSESLRVVELFLPPAIFDYPNREKQTHETIRGAFLNIIKVLLKDKKIALVPRMQLNWRECFPKISSSHVLSYHTSADFSKRHLHIQESPFAGYCSFDHSGFAGFASISENHDEIIKFVAAINSEKLLENQNEIYEKFVKHNISKYDQPKKSKSINGPYVFVALQVSTDVVAQLAWLSGIELLKTVAAYYRGSNTKVVVKRHPFCRSMNVQNCVEDLESSGDIIRTSGSIHELLKNATIVFTVNSGVGLEALIHGKAVVVSGACDYSYAAVSVKTPAELNNTLEKGLEPDPQRIREFLYFYANSFAIPSNDVRRLTGRLEQWLAN